MLELSPAEDVSAPAASAMRPAPQVSIVVPTFNEAGNVEPLYARIAAALEGVDWELVFVDDDSPDGTAAAVWALAQRDGRVRCLLRLGRRGLSSACVEGICASASPYVAVIDGDLQHDESLLAGMLAALRDGGYDVAVGSRYVEGGGTGDWSARRRTQSRWATRLSKLAARTELADPMSGFFMIRRDAALRSIRAGISGVGFKILLELFASAPQPLRHIELPYVFRVRERGDSKLDAKVAWDYALMLLGRLFGGKVPARFIGFSIVGAFGVLIHFTVLSTLFRGAGLSFGIAQTIATLIAMTINFALNNILTYSDVRLRGWGLLRGWVSFTLVCAVGTLANIGFAEWMFERSAGWVGAALGGVVVGAVWNYAMTSLFTWRGARA